LNDPWFYWLRPISTLVIQIDDWLDADPPAPDAANTAELLLAQVRTACPDAAGADFQQLPSLTPGRADGRGGARRSAQAHQRVSPRPLSSRADGPGRSHVLEFLLADPECSRVVTVGRRTTPVRHEKLEQRIVTSVRSNGRRPAPRRPRVLLSRTTIKQAGSQAAFRRVDHDFVVGLARADCARARSSSCCQRDRRRSESRVFYSRVKGEAEAAVRKLPYRAIQIFRPSLLLGKRAEFRLGERIMMLAAPLLSVFSWADCAAIVPFMPLRLRGDGQPRRQAPRTECLRIRRDGRTHMTADPFLSAAIRRLSKA